MTRNPFKIFFVVLSLLILTTCQEEIVSKRNYPRLRTLEVSNINNTGATFNAEIITNGKSDIIDHGFIWSEYESFPEDFSELISLGLKGTIGKFSAEISTTLEIGIIYYVKAYIATSDKLVYGQYVTFLGEGSAGPIIDHFEPQSGDVGDTITIIGQNYSRFINKMAVEFGKYNSNIVDLKEDTLKSIVPKFFEDTLSYISVLVVGNLTTSENAFLLNPPEIFSIAPLSGTSFDEITVTGKNFIPGNTKLYFDTAQIEITKLESGSITCIFPTNFQPKYYSVMVKVFDREIFAADSFLNITPYKYIVNPMEYVLEGKQ